MFGILTWQIRAMNSTLLMLKIQLVGQSQQLSFMSLHVRIWTFPIVELSVVILFVLIHYQVY